MLKRYNPFKLSGFLRTVFSKQNIHSRNHRMLYYGYARQALEDIYRILELKPGDFVLYPDYICDVILAPCHKLGLKILYYPIDNNFQPDWGKIEKIISKNKNIKVLLSVNYFGFPQDYKKWREITDRHKLIWTEDNAHGYGSEFQNQAMGTFGDFGISSLRKIFPLLNGACLHVKSDNEFAINTLPLITLYRFIGIEESVKIFKYLLQLMHIKRNKSWKSNLYSKMPPFNENDYRPWAIDPVSLRIFNYFQGRLKENRDIRRAIYKAWDNFCVSNGLISVFKSLPFGVSPMSYPCYAKDFTERQKWIEWGIKTGVDVLPWPSLPNIVRRSRQHCVERWRRLLCFPICQDMNPESIYNLRQI